MTLPELQTHYENVWGTPPPPELETRLAPYYGYLRFAAFGAPSPAPRVISSIPPDGLIIEEPGHYRLRGVIRWSASAATAVAITVASPDVTLDFTGATLKCLHGGLGVRGHTVDNVVVKGGTITGARLYGMLFTSCSGLIVDTMALDRLHNNDPGVIAAAIHLIQCPRARVSGCVVTRISATGTTVGGIVIVASTNTTVSHCCVSHLTNREGACAGIMHMLCLGLAVTDCQVSNLRTYPNNNPAAVGHTCIGILPTVCIGGTVARNHIRHVSGSCDDAHGVSVFVCALVKVRACVTENISTGNWGAQTSAKTTGVEVYGTDCEVRDCVARRITAKVPGDRQCTGFAVAWATDVLFKNCHAEDVFVTGLDGRRDVTRYGYGAGFGWAPDPRPLFRQVATRVRYEGCSAKLCQVGFDTWDHIDSVWDRPRSTYNDRAILESSRRQRRITCNRCSECPVPMDITISNRARGNRVVHPVVTKCVMG